MAFAALLQDFGFKTAFTGAGDLMRGMAIVTSGQVQWRIGNERGVDTLRELVVDSLMAFTTGFRNLLVADTGPWIIDGQDIVGCMAVGAHGCND